MSLLLNPVTNAARQPVKAMSSNAIAVSNAPFVELSVCEWDSNPYTLIAYDRRDNSTIAAFGSDDITVCSDRMDLFLIELGYDIYSDEDIASIYN